MKTTIVIAHPWKGSYNKAILAEITKHIPDHYLIDLYRDGFDPVMSEQDLALYSRGLSSDPLVAKYNEILDDTDRIIFIFPIWWYDMPAILRGFMDKVMLEGSAYRTEADGLHAVRHIPRTLLFTTSMAPTEAIVEQFGDPINGTIISATFEMVGFHNAKWINFGGIEASTEAERKDFLANIAYYL